MKLPRSARLAACLGLLFAILSAASPAAEPQPKWDPSRTTGPEDLNELKALQSAVSAVVEKGTPAVVALAYGNGSGSGVIVSENGLVLTAAHVISDYPKGWDKPYDPPPLPYTSGKRVVVMTSDGKEYEGKALGINRKLDSGMVQITDKGPNNGKWPFRPVGKSGDLQKGQWVVAVGHPLGPKDGRTPVARLGRVKQNKTGWLRSDCTMVVGDSGGPMFDLNGNVVGVLSRMVWPFSLEDNIHVPTDDITPDWDKMLAGQWVDRPPPQPAPQPKITAYFGVVFPEDDTDDAWLREVDPDGPADKAGLKPGDTLTKFNGTAVKSVKEFRKLLAGVKPADKVTITARRGIEILTLTVTLGKR